MIVFNNLDSANGFEVAIEEANNILSDIGIHLDYNFIRDYVGIDGEYAYTLSVEKYKELNDDNQLDLL
tara:strand:- start:807 stop:1010 length:204 start_codon:yes stop_codon:yes gene_type:complete